MLVPAPPVLRVDALSKSFFLHERGIRIHAFGGVSFTASAGELTALVGASGSGKSSIIKCIHRTYLPDAGMIRYRDASGHTLDLVAAAEPRILALRRGEVRLVRQTLRALPRQTATQVTARPLIDLGVGRDEACRRARATLKRVGLPSRLWDIPPWTFSGGERQLINLAQAVAVEPRLLLLDEPTASLDDHSRRRVLALIASLKRSRMTIVGVFHDKEAVEQLADHRVEIAGGLHAPHAAAAG